MGSGSETRLVHLRPNQSITAPRKIQALAIDDRHEEDLDRRDVLSRNRLSELRTRPSNLLFALFRRFHRAIQSDAQALRYDTSRIESAALGCAQPHLGRPCCQPLFISVADLADK
jgi:hypothetical protein